MPFNLAAVVSIVTSAVLGTGGVGYALVQWWIKRNDPEVRANAASVLTDAAGKLVLELQKEKLELKREIQCCRDEMRNFRTEVRVFVGVVEDVMPLLHGNPDLVTRLRASLQEMRQVM